MKRMLLTLCGLALAVSTNLAQVTAVAKYNATVANLADAPGAVFNLDVIRWSTDAERDAVTASLAKGESAVTDALKAQPTVGYLWTGESVGYPVKLASRVQMPDGTERVVLATDRRLGVYTGRPWTARAPAQTESYTFTLIELRVPKAGVGEGKMSINAKVTADTAAKTLAIDNYAAATVTLRNVRRPPSGT